MEEDPNKAEGGGAEQAAETPGEPEASDKPAVPADAIATVRIQGGGRDAPTRRMPHRLDEAGDGLSGLTAAWMRLYGAVEGLFSLVFGWAFRIREPLPVALKAILPLVFLALLGLGWSRATRGEFYLGRFSKLSALDAQREEIEKVTRCPVKLGTREKKTFSSREPQLEICEITLPKAIYDARRDELKQLGQFEVVLPTVEAPPAGEVTLKSGFIPFGRIPAKSAKDTEADARTSALKAALPGVKLEERLLPPDQSGRWLLLERAIASKDVAATSTARAALDAVIGAGGWITTALPDGTIAITGTERKEDRPISSVILPSPREMLDSIPSALNQRWNTWADAKAWWEGREVVKPRFEGPRPLDRRELNEVPFALLERGLYKTLGPSWKDWLLLHAVLWSTVRIVLGFACAAVVAIPLGVLMGSFSKPRALLEPIRLMGSYLPLPAFVGLTLAWWGTSEAQKVGFLAIASFVVLLPQVIMAVEAVPQTHLLSALTLGATRLQQVRYILYAGARAEIFRALRLTFAVGWTWVTLAESVDPKAGLGYVMFLGERRAEHRPHIYVVIVLIVGLAFLVNSAWAWVERKLYPYREADVE